MCSESCNSSLAELTLLAQLVVNLTASVEVEQFTDTLKSLESRLKPEVKNETEGSPQQEKLSQVLAPITGAWSLVNKPIDTKLEILPIILYSLSFLLVLPGILAYYHITRDDHP